MIFYFRQTRSENKASSSFTTWAQLRFDLSSHKNFYICYLRCSGWIRSRRKVNWSEKIIENFSDIYSTTVWEVNEFQHFCVDESVLLTVKISFPSHFSPSSKASEKKGKKNQIPNGENDIFLSLLLHRAWTTEKRRWERILNEWTTTKKYLFVKSPR